MREVALITMCVLLYGTATFFKRLGLMQFHPYQFLLVSGICYFTFVPVWCWLLSRQNEPLVYSGSGLLYAVLYSVLSVVAGFILSFLLRGTNTPGTMIVMVNLSSVVTLLLSSCFLHEHLGFNKLVAVALAIVSLVLMNL